LGEKLCIPVLWACASWLEIFELACVVLLHCVLHYYYYYYSFVALLLVMEEPPARIFIFIGLAKIVFEDD